MKRKIFKSDVESLRLQGREIMNSSIDSRFYNRVAAVNAVLSGVSPNVACEWFNMTSRSLTGWVKKVDEQGFESLRDKVRPGAPQKQAHGPRRHKNAQRPQAVAALQS